MVNLSKFTSIKNILSGVVESTTNFVQSLIMMGLKKFRVDDHKFIFKLKIYF